MTWSVWLLPRSASDVVHALDELRVGLRSAHSRRRAAGQWPGVMNDIWEQRRGHQFSGATDPIISLESRCADPMSMLRSQARRASRAQPSRVGKLWGFRSRFEQADIADCWTPPMARVSRAINRRFFGRETVQAGYFQRARGAPESAEPPQLGFLASV